MRAVVWSSIVLLGLNGSVAAQNGSQGRACQVARERIERGTGARLAGLETRGDVLDFEHPEAARLWLTCFPGVSLSITVKARSRHPSPAFLDLVTTLGPIIRRVQSGALRAEAERCIRKAEDESVPVITTRVGAARLRCEALDAESRISVDIE